MNSRILTLRAKYSNIPDQCKQPLDEYQNWKLPQQQKNFMTPGGRSRCTSVCSTVTLKKNKKII
jgi:hypothetical protein